MYKIISLLKIFMIFIFMFGPSEQDLTDSKPSVDQNVTLQFDFHFESLSITLYNNDVNQVCSKFLYLEINT
jgi:hypothetical protein